MTAALREGHRARRRRETATAYTLLIPSFVGVGLFLVVPVLIVVVLTFMRWDLISPPQWVGLANYEWLASNGRFWNSLLVTATFVLLAIPASVALGLLLALGLNRRLPGSNLLRIVYVLPWVCAPLALGVVWRWLLDPANGAVNVLFGRRIEWMSDPSLALPAVAFVYVWTQVGYISLFFLAGLQNIPRSVYDAAKIDGAGPVRTLFSLTLPLLRPTTFFVSVTSVIASFQVFDLVYGLTGSAAGYPAGSTDVIVTRIYQEAFVSLNLGRASVMALALFAVLVVVTVVQQRYFSRRTTYDMS
ncbi:sugar ABC transporter permease [Leucobacter sp. CSA1]|uniref:Sugar ABC transporter permease n=1 Tax=Leucobacter chromiisoli TaxID=2796471 RepID=A0A934QAE2_9MICO|nr:sugar ABC transporter permease [Leucobacter chromiisoli]MBK0419697.1 sugar ABC transporter permease [Leucobacter chromiisoli]